ncbi:MAG: ABC transporter ATP-binding protein [Actinomycetales bacterium]|nr:ABC transporter ATP-binding protein [Actinomycetales bacterium]
MSVRASVRLARGAFDLDAELAVQAGTTVAVLGPNGAGKSTLLRALAGLERIDQGRIEIDGRIVDDGDSVFVQPRARNVGLVFQDYALFGHLTVLENVAFGPRARGEGRQRSRQVAHEVLARLGIDHLADRRPSQVSGGQAQRVALARALATGPSLLLMDEPLAALDAETRTSVRIELQRQLAEYPGCAVLVTHDPLDAMLLADRIVVLESGAIAQEGTPGDLARRPATPYVAALMGVNLLSGTAVGGELALDGGGTLRIADQGLQGRALAVIRPEAITISLHEPQGSARNAWQGRVTAVELLHDRVRVHIEGRPGVIAAVTPAAIADLRIDAGTAVWLSVKAVEIDAYPHPAR